MVKIILLMMLQSAVYGPTAPVPEIENKGVAGMSGSCPPSSSGEIVVCKRKSANSGTPIQTNGPNQPGILDDEGRLNLRLEKNAQLGGGGPMGKNGQSVGATLRIHF